MDIVPAATVDATEAVPGAHLKLLAGGEQMNVQHFSIDPGAVVPAHDHPHEQTGYILEGELTFTVGGETLVASAGDSYVIPGGETHGAENHGEVPVVGLDIFSPPRDNPDWQD